MKLHRSLRLAAGFTLIELMVVIAIMVTLAGIAGTAIYSHMGVGDEAKCRAHLEQLVQLELVELLLQILLSLFEQQF